MVRIGGRAFVPREVWDAARPATPVSGSYDEWLRGQLDVKVSSRMPLASVVSITPPRSEWKRTEKRYANLPLSKPATPQDTESISALTTETRWKSAVLRTAVRLRAGSGQTVYVDQHIDGVLIRSLSVAGLAASDLEFWDEVDPTSAHTVEWYGWATITDVYNWFEFEAAVDQTIRYVEIGTVSTSEKLIYEEDHDKLLGTISIEGKVRTEATDTAYVRGIYGELEFSGSAVGKVDVAQKSAFEPYSSTLSIYGYTSLGADNHFILTKIALEK